MKQIQTTDDLKGKTVAKVYKCFEELWVSFTDGTFVLYRAENDYGDTSLELVTKAPNFLKNRLALQALGLATPEEVEASEKERAELLRKNREEHERAELARLLAKYPRQ